MTRKTSSTSNFRWRYEERKRTDTPRLRGTGSAARLGGLAGAGSASGTRHFGAVLGPLSRRACRQPDYLYLGGSYALRRDPALVYDASGLTGYVASRTGTDFIPTYYYLKEALRTQSPGRRRPGASASLRPLSELHPRSTSAICPFPRYQTGGHLPGF